MAKSKLTQDDVARIADEVLDAAQPVHDIIKALNGMKVEGINDEGMKAAQTLAAAARLCSDAVVQMLSAVNHARLQRRLDVLRSEGKGGESHD